MTFASTWDSFRRATGPAVGPVRVRPGQFAVVAPLDGRGDERVRLPLSLDEVRVVAAFDSEAEANRFVLERLSESFGRQGYPRDIVGALKRYCPLIGGEARAAARGR